MGRSMKSNQESGHESFAELAAIHLGKSRKSPKEPFQIHELLPKLEGYVTHEYEGDTLRRIHFIDKSVVINRDGIWLPKYDFGELPPAMELNLSKKIDEIKSRSRKQVAALATLIPSVIMPFFFYILNTILENSASKIQTKLEEDIKSEFNTQMIQHKDIWNDSFHSLFESSVTSSLKATRASHTAIDAAMKATDAVAKISKAEEEASNSRDISIDIQRQTRSFFEESKKDIGVYLKSIAGGDTSHKLLKKIISSEAKNILSTAIENGSFKTNIDVIPGTICAYAGQVDAEKAKGRKICEVERGWLLCNGALIGELEEDGKYGKLVQLLRGHWGNKTEETINTARIPDLRGLFLRGVDHGRGMDPGAKERGDRVGTFQDQSIMVHSHKLIFSLITSSEHGGTPWMAKGYKTSHAKKFHNDKWVMSEKDTETTLGPVDGVGKGLKELPDETRPKNAYVNWIIKY